jgi:hypothetical protein
VVEDFNVSIAKREEEYADILRDRIMERICSEIRYNNKRSFHRVDLVTAAFFDQAEDDKYRYSTQDTEYTRLLGLVYRPLVECGLIVENENNNFTVTDAFPTLCQRELQSKSYIDWRAISWQRGSR